MVLSHYLILTSGQFLDLSHQLLLSLQTHERNQLSNKHYCLHNSKLLYSLRGINCHQNQVQVSSLIIMRDPKGITWNTLFRKNNTKNIIMFFDQKVEDVLFTKVI